MADNNQTILISSSDGLASSIASSDAMELSSSGSADENPFLNTYNAPIVVDSYTYPTCAHYFYAQMFLPDHPEIALEICSVSAHKAYFISNNNVNRHLIRSDWHHGYKDAIMLKGLEAKFSQHADLQELLLRTGTARLVKHTTKHDNYWGDNGDGTGKNQLGQLLMIVREKIRYNFELEEVIQMFIKYN